MLHPTLKKVIQQAKYVPVGIRELKRGNKAERPLDIDDKRLIEQIEKEANPHWYPTDSIERDIDMWYERDYRSLGLFTLDGFYTRRNLRAFSTLWEFAYQLPHGRIRNAVLFTMSGMCVNLSKMNRWRPNVSFPYNPISGTLYVPALPVESNVFHGVKNKVSRLTKVWSNYLLPGRTAISTQSSAKLTLIDDNSVDYIFTDPPLLLLAIKNVASEKGDEELAAEIHETFLVHRHKKGMQRYKLVPRTGDREVYQAMLDDKPYDTSTPRLLTEGYDYFRKLVQTYCVDEPQRLKNLFDTVINRIYLVVITLDKEDPYEIFDSLNSTGLPLEESDLIRNYVFMQVPLDLQEEFQSECWQDFENSFDKEGLAIHPTRFYREFLSRDGKYIKKDSVFAEFRNHFELNALTPEKCVGQLHHYLKIARSIASDGAGLPASIRQSLLQLNSMDVESTVNPLLMNLLNLYSNDAISESDLNKCILDDRAAIEATCVEKLEWVNGSKQSIVARKKNVSIKDQIDWLEQHEWMAKTLGHFHRALFDRLTMLSKSIKEKSDHKQQLTEYWTGLHCHLFESGSSIVGTTPLPQNWCNFAIGRSWCSLSAAVAHSQDQLRVALYLAGPDAKMFFEQLFADKSRIESEFGQELEWFSADSHKQSRISLFKNGTTFGSPESWSDDFNWMRETLTRFDKVFRDRIAALK